MFLTEYKLTCTMDLENTHVKRLEVQSFSGDANILSPHSQMFWMNMTWSAGNPTACTLHTTVK